MVEDNGSRPALELEEAARALHVALAAFSDTNFVQGTPGDAVIDGTFDLTIVLRELRANGYEIHRRV